MTENRSLNCIHSDQGTGLSWTTEPWMITPVAELRVGAPLLRPLYPHPTLLGIWSLECLHIRCKWLVQSNFNPFLTVFIQSWVKGQFLSWKQLLASLDSALSRSLPVVGQGMMSLERIALPAGQCPCYSRFWELDSPVFLHGCSDW